jgi:hypothetical protein
VVVEINVLAEVLVEAVFPVTVGELDLIAEISALVAPIVD